MAKRPPNYRKPYVQPNKRKHGDSLEADHVISDPYRYLALAVFWQAKQDLRSPPPESDLENLSRVYSDPKWYLTSDMSHDLWYALVGNSLSLAQIRSLAS